MNIYDCENYIEGGRCSLSNEKVSEEMKRKFCLSMNNNKCPELKSNR